MPSNLKKDWEEYVAREKARVQPILTRDGFSFDEIQPQTVGERYLTRPVGGGRKVVFFGRRILDGARVVIKTSSEAAGIEELKQERQTRQTLEHINFAYGQFSFPRELQFNPAEGLLITEYIEQDTPFVERPLKEQFQIALDAFKEQEGAHATTSGHEFQIAKHFIKPGEYKKVGSYAQDLASLLSDEQELYSALDSLLDRTTELVGRNEETLDRYGNFLTHWDFIPQNFRIREGRLYLLDHTSIRFGNKYEGWARFINFMVLYNPPLATALVEYVRLNRAPEELLALKIMRAYRLVELIRYYASWLPRTEGNDRELARARILFWTQILRSVLDEQEVPADVISSYKTKRDRLRSADEKLRQKDLH